MNSINIPIWVFQPTIRNDITCLPVICEFPDNQFLRQLDERGQFHRVIESALLEFFLPGGGINIRCDVVFIMSLKRYSQSRQTRVFLVNEDVRSKCAGDFAYRVTQPMFVQNALLHMRMCVCEVEGLRTQLTLKHTVYTASPQNKEILVSLF